MKCLACSVEKDISVLEVFPYPEADMLCDDPIAPLLTIECGENGVWKKVIVCHHCFYKIDPDMWIDKKIWESINPVTPFENLPSFKDETI